MSKETTSVAISKAILEAAIDQHRKIKRLNPEEKIHRQGFIASLLAKYAAGNLVEKEVKHGK